MSNHLFLDIDGVLNAVGALSHVSESKRPWQDYALVPQERFSETYSPEMIRHLNEVIERWDVKVTWLTTWESEAPTFGKKIGLTGSENWPWLNTRDRFGIWGKHASIRSELMIHRERNDNIIWIDDDLQTEPDAQLWAADARVLTIAPYVHHGILPAHIALMNTHYAEGKR